MIPDGLVAAILADPDSDDLRMILADFLEESGDEKKATRLREPGWWWLVQGVPPLQSLVWMRDFSVGSKVNPSFDLAGQTFHPVCSGSGCCGLPRVVSDWSGTWVCAACYGTERRQDDGDDR